MPRPVAANGVAGSRFANDVTVEQLQQVPIGTKFVVPSGILKATHPLQQSCGGHYAAPAASVVPSAGSTAPAHASSNPLDQNVHPGDTVFVGGRRGVVVWDGRPDHQFVMVRWEDGSADSGVPLAELSTEPTGFHQGLGAAYASLPPAVQCAAPWLSSQPFGAASLPRPPWETSRLPHQPLQPVPVAAAGAAAMLPPQRFMVPQPPMQPMPAPVPMQAMLPAGACGPTIGQCMFPRPVDYQQPYGYCNALAQGTWYPSASSAAEQAMMTRCPSYPSTAACRTNSLPFSDNGAAAGGHWRPGSRGHGSPDEAVEQTAYHPSGFPMAEVSRCNTADTVDPGIANWRPGSRGPGASPNGTPANACSAEMVNEDDDNPWLRARVPWSSPSQAAGSPNGDCLDPEILEYNSARPPSVSSATTAPPQGPWAGGPSPAAEWRPGSRGRGLSPCRSAEAMSPIMQCNEAPTPAVERYSATQGLRTPPQAVRPDNGETKSIEDQPVLSSALHSQNQAPVLAAAASWRPGSRGPDWRPGSRGQASSSSPVSKSLNDARDETIGMERRPRSKDSNRSDAQPLSQFRVAGSVAPIVAATVAAVPDDATRLAADRLLGPRSANEQTLTPPTNSNASDVPASSNAGTTGPPFEDEPAGAQTVGPAASTLETWGKMAKARADRIQARNQNSDAAPLTETNKSPPDGYRVI